MVTRKELETITRLSGRTLIEYLNPLQMNGGIRFIETGGRGGPVVYDPEEVVRVLYSIMDASGGVKLWGSPHWEAVAERNGWSPPAYPDK